jgi:hypothetical protein
MAKITFTALTVAAYSLGISKLRTALSDIASWVEKSPAAVTDVANQLGDLTAYIGVTLPAAGTPGQPTSLSAIANGATGAVLLFAGGANTTSYEYALNKDAGGYGAWTALPSNRAIAALTAGSHVFKVRGVNAGANGVESAAAAALVLE